MSRVIVIEFVTLDGVIENPEAWALRYGPETVAGDKFRLGEVMETGALLLGRATWQLFAGIWPSRTDDFSVRMNRMRKLVASRSREDVGAWSNSTLLRGDLVEAVRTRDRDLVVAGSASVVATLMEHDLVDEFRLLVFPTVLGSGRRLFDGGAVDLELVSAEQVGEAVLLVYGR